MSCDLAIVGAGPAGMAAALEAEALGLAVTVFDDQPEPGGQIWRALKQSRKAGRLDKLGDAYAAGADVIARFRRSKAQYRPRTQVWQIEPEGRLYTLSDGRAEAFPASRVLLANGAQERPTPFPGWTLPGVMTVGAAQIMLKTSHQIPDHPVWIAGCGPLVLLYATQLLDHGGKIAGILDTGTPGKVGAALPHLPSALGNAGDLVKGLKWILRLKRAGVPFISNVSEIAVEGNGRVESLRYTTTSGASRTVPASLVLVHEGVIPNIHVTMSLRCEHDWREDQHCYAPRLDAWGQSSQQTVFVAGDAAGIGGADAALGRGHIAAIGVALSLGRLDAEAATRRAAPYRAELKRVLATRPLLDALYPPRRQIHEPADNTLVCRCEEVSAGDIRAVANVGRPGPNQMKSFTRCGMGPCQGRMCGYTVSHVLAAAHGIAPQDAGFFRIRPPLRQISLAELATLEDTSGGNSYG